MEAERGLSAAPGLSTSFHIEDLPEEIKPRVMSLLSLKEAARTSIVATNWRQLWTCYPNLCFDGSNDGSTDDENNDVIKIGRANFIATVNSIIQQHSGAGLDKFSITYNLKMRSWDHLDRWICFATASKAKIININLWAVEGVSIRHVIHVYNFPLEALGAQEGPFIQSLFLKYVSIKPHLDMCGFTKLRRLVLHYVRIIGDLPGLLNDCCALEDLELMACCGVADLNVPRRLNKLRRLVISQMRVHMVDFHATGLTQFEFDGDVIPITLHGCTKLEKVNIYLGYASVKQNNNRALCHAFTAIPSISAVEVLKVQVHMDHQWVQASQVHTLITKPMHVFVNLRHLTCEIRTIVYHDPNGQNGILQLAHYLNFAPHLEMLQLHMNHHYALNRSCWHGEVTGEEVSCCMSRLDHLKTVYMSGFRCYRAQAELLCNILKRGAALEQVTIQPNVTIDEDRLSKHFGIPEDEIREWAHHTSERFGKTITVV
ncbi:unnamed protein product [Urochloa humidicola]